MFKFNKLTIIMLTAALAFVMSQVVWAQEKTVVKLWHLFNTGEPIADLYADVVVPGFEADNPGIKIELRAAGRDIVQKIMAGLLSGDFPDIIEDMPSTIYPTLVVSDEALVLDDMLDELDYDGKVPFRNRVGDLVWDYLERWWVREDGKIEQMVRYMNLLGIGYNGIIFDDLGLTEPRTWTEFLDVSAKIKASGVAPIVMASDTWYYTAMWYANLVMRMNPDSGFYDIAADKSGEAWDKPMYLEAAKIVEDFVKEGYFIKGYEGYAWPSDLIAMTQGKVAMEIGGSWQWMETNQQNPDPNVFQYRFMGFPELEGYPGKATHLLLDVNSSAILRRTPVVDAAKRLFKYLYTDKIVLAFQTVGKSLPPTPGLPGDKDFPSIYRMRAASTKMIEGYHGVPGLYPDWMTGVFVPENNKLIFGRITAEQFIENMKKGTIQYWKGK